MNDNEVAEDTLLTLTADIVAAHVSTNRVAVNDLPTLIQNVHSALSGISSSRSAPEAKPEPKVVLMPPHAEVDRLIFYRGASDRGGPLHVFTGDDRVFKLRNQCDKPIPACFAVQASPHGI